MSEAVWAHERMRRKMHARVHSCVGATRPCACFGAATHEAMGVQACHAQCCLGGAHFAIKEAISRSSCCSLVLFALGSDDLDDKGNFFSCCSCR